MRLRKVLKNALDYISVVQKILEADGQTGTWPLGYTLKPEGTWQDTADDECPWDHQYITMIDQGTHYLGTLSIPVAKEFYLVFGYTVLFDYSGEDA